MCECVCVCVLWSIVRVCSRLAGNKTNCVRCASGQQCTTCMCVDNCGKVLRPLRVIHKLAMVNIVTTQYSDMN